LGKHVEDRVEAKINNECKKFTFYSESFVKKSLNKIKTQSLLKENIVDTYQTPVLHLIIVPPF
jgi:hypothetical protein